MKSDSIRWLLCPIAFSLGASAWPQEAKRVDLDGKPLPERAICRLGSDRFLQDHSVKRTAFSGDGKLFASADGFHVMVWDWPTGKELHKHFFPHIVSAATKCNAMSFSPDGKYLAIGSRELHFVRIADGKVISRSAIVSPPAFSRKGTQVAWLETPATACIMTDPESENVRRLPERKGTMTALTWNDANEVLAMEIHEQKARLVNLTLDKIVHEMQLRAAVTWAEFTPDGQRLAFATATPEVQVFDIATKKLRFPPAQIPPDHTLQALRGDGKAIVIHSPNTNRAHGNPQLWSLEKSKLIADLHGGRKDTVSFSPNGEFLAMGNGVNLAHAARFWDARTGKPLDFYSGHLMYVGSLAISPDGKEAATSCFWSDPYIRFWDTTTGNSTRKILGHSDSHESVAYLPDGKSVAFGGFWNNDTDIAIWDIEGMKRVKKLKGHLHGSYGIAVSADGKRLVSIGGGTSPDDAIVWDLATGERLATHNNVGNNVRNRVAFLPDGLTVAIWNQDKIRFWDWQVNRERHFKMATTDMNVTSDGLLIAVMDPSYAKLIDVATGQEIWRVGVPEGNSEGPTSIGVAPNGRTIALSNGNGMIKLVDWPTEKHLLFLGATRGPGRLTFFPDSRRLAGAEYNSVLIWDVADFANLPLPVRAKTPAADLDRWCVELGSNDAKVAYRAVWNLVASQDAAVPGLKSQFARLDKPAAKNIPTWIADLDSPVFATRDMATKKLLYHGDEALRLLEAEVKKNQSLEHRRRLAAIIDIVKDGQTPARKAKELRVIMTLEQIGTSAARAVMDWLTDDVGNAWLAQHARRARQRMDVRQMHAKAQKGRSP